MALAWIAVTKKSGRVYLTHTGGTGGYSAFLGLDRAAGLGTAVLVNSRVTLSFNRAVIRFFESLPV